MKLRIEWARPDTPRTTTIDTYPNASGEWVPVGELTEADFAAMPLWILPTAIAARAEYLRPRRGYAFREAA